MAGTADSATQTSEFGSDQEFDSLVTSSPRVVIDTSPPFGSVEEAVIRFGGRGFWIPRPDLGLHPPHDHQQNPEDSDIYKLEERTATMLKDLQMKEQETFELLKELELTKQLVEDLKMKLPKEGPEHKGFDGKISTPEKEYVKKLTIDSTNNHATKPVDHSNSLPLCTAELILMELKQAKLSLYQNTSDLAAIRGSVEFLSRKMEKQKDTVEVEAREIQTTNALNEGRSNTRVRNNNAETLGGSINPLTVSRELRELSYEAEQFMKTAEAARSEVLKAMSDIEQTKTGLKVIEMRWVAARKLEEAARAAESLALAEIRALSSNERLVSEGYQQKPGRISLSFEEYSALTDKAQKAENLLRRKDFDPFRKVEEATEAKLSKMAFEGAVRRFGSDPSRPRRDSRLLDASEFELVKNEGKPVLRPTTSIGDILSRKLVLRDDLEVARQGEAARAGRQRTSLNQMLRRQRGETSPLRRRDGHGGGAGAGAGEQNKHFFSKRKTLGFVHISLPLLKQSKNKIQDLNLW